MKQSVQLWKKKKKNFLSILCECVGYFLSAQLERKITDECMQGFENEQHLSLFNLVQNDSEEISLYSHSVYKNFNLGCVPRINSNFIWLLDNYYCLLLRLLSQWVIYFETPSIYLSVFSFLCLYWKNPLKKYDLSYGHCLYLLNVHEKFLLMWWWIWWNIVTNLGRRGRLWKWSWRKGHGMMITMRFVESRIMCRNRHVSRLGQGKVRA